MGECQRQGEARRRNWKALKETKEPAAARKQTSLQGEVKLKPSEHPSPGSTVWRRSKALPPGAAARQGPAATDPCAPQRRPAAGPEVPGRALSISAGTAAQREQREKNFK